MEPEWMHRPQALEIINDCLKRLQQLQGGGEILRSLFFGANSPQKTKTGHWCGLEKGLGSDWQHEWSLRNGKEGDYWSRGVLKCMIGMKVQCSIRGQREEWTQLLERNGAKMEIIYCKQMDKQPHVFYFLHNYWVVGKSWGSSGSAAGQSVDFVRLLYIIRLYLSLLFRRQAGIEYNYMLCIIASGCFFLAQVQHGGGGWSANVFFASWVDWLIDFSEEREKAMCQNVRGLQKVWQKKQQQGGLCGGRQKDCASPASTGSATDASTSQWPTLRQAQ
jgi:hypothetical protein